MTELQLQKTSAEYLDRHPKTRGCWWHTPNGGDRTKVGGSSLKAQGVKAGVPDIIVARPVASGGCLAIELKTPKGYVSKAQQGWHTRLSRLGWVVAVCRSITEVVEAVEAAYGSTRSAVAGEMTGLGS